jgi:hypothetical protein
MNTLQRRFTTTTKQLHLQLNKLIFINNKYAITLNSTVMEYVMSCSDASAFHHELPFTPLHYIYVPFTSSPHFTSLHSTPLHFAAFSDDFSHTFTSPYLSLS